MIHIDPNRSGLSPERLEEWSKWQEKAKAATIRVIDSWETWFMTTPRTEKAPDIPYKDQQIWRDLRSWLFKNVFHDKCAYCETKVIRDTGDAEHYRPKGKVTFSKEVIQHSKVPMITAPNDKIIKHPGYFWLAFCWENLLPSCKCCNAINGKGTQFPSRANSYIFLEKLSSKQLVSLKVKPIESPNWPGWYYLGSVDLDIREEPLLLHPYFDEPAMYLFFGEGGLVFPRLGGDIKKAYHSIKIFDLQAEKLRQARQREQTAAVTQYMLKVGTLVQEGKNQKEAFTEAFDTLRVLNPDAPYSAAATDAVRNCNPYDDSSYLYVENIYLEKCRKYLEGKGLDSAQILP